MCLLVHYSYQQESCLHGSCSSMQNLSCKKTEVINVLMLRSGERFVHRSKLKSISDQMTGSTLTEEKAAELFLFSSIET